MTFEKGTVRFDIGMSFLDRMSLPLAGIDVNEMRLFDTGVSYAVADYVEIEARAPLLLRDMTRDHWDTGDIDLSVKIRTRAVEGVDAMALRMGVSLPQTADTYGLGNDQMSFRSDLLMSWYRSRYDLHINAGLIIEDDPVSPRSQNDLLRYGVAFIYKSRISPLIEISGRGGPGGPGTDDIHNLLIGARLPRHGLLIDIGWSVGLNRVNHRFGISAGLTWQGRRH